MSFSEIYQCVNLNFGFFNHTHQIFRIWIFRSYVKIQNFTISYTVYHTYDHNTSRTANKISHLATTCKSNVCEDPTEMLGVI